MLSFLSNFARRRRPSPINDAATLQQFIDGHSAFIAQSSLYGYIKTRSGFEYFRLFEDPQFVASINIAKWNIYAACISDLSLFCGAHIHKKTQVPDNNLTDFMRHCVKNIFAHHKRPTEANDAYDMLVQKAQTRIAQTSWPSIADNESPFSESPQALVLWAPIADHHKQYDANIVKNSITFKWKEPRDKFRQRVDATALATIIRASADNR